jgi:(E)-4-hydroxy-3-methylbut-2-enyl-diphosphate synthase
MGGCCPVVVQSMTDTDTADASATAAQCAELARAGAEIVRIAVDRDESAAAVPEIRKRLDDAGYRVPLVGDFHFNGHLLLRRHPGCATTLDKFRVNPGNVDRRGGGSSFCEICAVARDTGAALRIGVNGGSLDRDLVARRMDDNARGDSPSPPAAVLDSCMVESALSSVDAAAQNGVGLDRIVVSCKVSSPPSLIRIYRDLASKTRQPLHLGLTEAGQGPRGLVWSTAAMAVLLDEGIGNTIRVSITPEPGQSRTAEVEAAREILQALGLRSFAPTVISCPGCGRTAGEGFRILASRVNEHLKRRMKGCWRSAFPGVEDLRIAVMGCVVNGPGETGDADLGISLPGVGEAPRCRVLVDGRTAMTLQGSMEEVAEQFVALIDDYVSERYGGRSECSDS